MTRRVLIIHGFDASPQAHWFPWLTACLHRAGAEVCAPTLPQSRAPDFDAWQQALADAVGRIRDDDVFVAHSLGCPALLHFLSAQTPTVCGGLVLAAGFAAPLPGLRQMNGYCFDDFMARVRVDTAALRACCQKTVALISDNDAAVAPQASAALAQALGAQTVWIADGRHLLGAQGFRRLPQALRAVRDIWAHCPC